MQHTSKLVVLSIIKKIQPKSILDVPSGDGWLAQKLKGSVSIDGIDLFRSNNQLYRNWETLNLDDGIPDSFRHYDCITSCEGLEHFGNPELFLRTAYRSLNTNGTLLITTPNVWHPQARLQYMLRGFFPGFPNLAGKVNRGEHMHIIPWSFPQLYIFFKLAGFSKIRLHYEPMSKPKHIYERLFAVPQFIYCKRKSLQATSSEEKNFWDTAVSKESLFGRHLIVTAVKL